MNATTLKQLLDIRRELKAIEGLWNGDEQDMAGDNSAHASNAIYALDTVIEEYNQII